jgi:PKD repeat protein
MKMKTKNLQYLKIQPNTAKTHSIAILLKKLYGIINFDTLHHGIHEYRPIKSSLLLPSTLFLTIILGFFIQGHSHTNINRDESSIGPVINVGTLTDFGNKCINTTSEIQSYIVSGTSLTNTVVITPPSGFEISLSGLSFDAAPYINLHPSIDGSIPDQTIYVRFKPASSQIYSANITHSSTGAITQNVAVTGTGIAVPVAYFSGTSTTVTVGGNVTFTDNSTNTPTSWSWSFPGGTPSSSTDQNPSVTYNTAGNYSVSLTATNDCGFNEETQLGYITVTSPCTIPVAAVPSTGDGTSSNPYQIATLENLYWIAMKKEAWDKYFIQTEDIDASETANWCTGGWLPIGNWYVDESTDKRVFSGSYNGQGHTISGLHVEYNSSYIAFGLFGTVRGATIKNLGIINVNINISDGSNSITGALVGISAGSLIENCHSTGNLLNQSSGNSGGLVGESSGLSSVIGSYSSCNVTGTHITGGLVGNNSNSSITNCYYFSGTVDGSESGNSNTGGLVGMNYFNSTISRCYSTGIVAGYEYAGGLVGSNIGNAQITNCFSRCSVSSAIESWKSGGFTGENDATITNCYSTGLVTGIRKRGFLGSLVGGAIVNCFWDTETSGTSLSEGGTGKTTAEIKTQLTFTDWNFTSIWGIDAAKNDGYPYLQPESSCANGTIALTSGTENQTICAGTAITPIVYTTGGGATGATVSPNLPTGLSGVYDANAKTFTISGTPEVLGNFSYTVETTGSSPCTEETATGTIIVKVQPVATAPAIGNGTIGNPYQITTLENLYWIRANPSSWTKYFIQTQDIDASTTSDWCTGGWLPIGIAWENSQTEIKVFSGSYDGQGHTISGLHITQSTTVAYGLFGMTRGAVIKSLGITNVEISEVTDCVGALVGYASGVSIYNCYSTGNVSGLSYVGGLVGAFNTASKMNNCQSSCIVNGAQNVGGLVGTNDASEIIYCFSSNVAVTGNGYYIGGLVGTNISTASISKCYSTGTVSGSASVGGLVGINMIDANISNCFSRANIFSVTDANNNGGLVGWNDRAYIYNSYSTGSVGQYMGGLVGTNSGYVVSNSFWDKQTSGVDHSSGGTGKTTAEMKGQSTFTDWDFSVIWGINADNNDGYPYFKCTNATLAISSGSNTSGVCVNTAITPIVYIVGGASGATISPTLPNGLSGTYDSGGKTFTISGTPTVTGTYTYTITTTGTPLLCSEATATGTITVNPQPEVSISSNNSPICYDTDAYFYLEGTPGAEVIYSFDGGTTTWTVSLAGGTATVVDIEARNDVTLSLISIKNISTGCIKTLNSASKVIVISPTVSISGTHTACTSTILTAVTNASSPTYYWGTLNDEGLILPAGEGPTLVVTEAGNYILMVIDGITGCDKLSEAFTVTFIPEPEVSIINNNSPICYAANARFYLEGTPGAVVTYSFDGGETTSTVTLTEGTVTVEDMEARGDVTLSLISIKINSTGCIKALNETSTVTVNSPTASISGDHIACSSTTLTAVTNASSPKYFWATADENGWDLLGEGSTFEVTKSGIYYLAVLDGITGCDGLSDPFDVTINPAPEVQVTPTSYNITEGGSVTLTATGTADTYTWSPSAGLNVTTGATVVAKPVKNTTYTVTGFIGGCSNTASAVITVQELCKNSADQYEPNNSMLDNLFSIPINLTISANLLNAKDPDWYRLEITDQAKYTLKLTKTGTVNPSVDLYGSNGRRLKSIDRTQPFSYNLAPGTYYIKLSAGVKTYLCYTLQVVNDGPSVGAIASFDDTKSAKIIEPVPDGIFRIWPNPSKNEFKLYNGNENQVRLRVVDVIGRTIETIENVGISETIAFGNKYKPGIYFVEALGNGVQKVFKIVKQ